MKNNAVIYARYSSEKQTEQSIEGQLRDCYAFAERHNYNIVGEYIDRAFSGMTDERPEFQKMIEDSNQQLFNYVIVWKLDRFSRDRVNSAMYKVQLKKNGVKVLSAMEEMVNADTPESVLLEAILEAQAQMYSMDLSQKVKRGQRETVEKRQFIGGHLPLGYKCENKKIVVDKQKSEYVKYLFTEYANGKPKKKIIEELNAMGATGVNGRPLSIKSVQCLLKNRKYLGEWCYNGELITDIYPRIIENKIFDEVQIMLTKNKQRAGKETAKTNFLLSGKCYCAICGAPMIGISGTSRTGERYHYYACSNQYNKSKCVKKYEKQRDLEEYAINRALDFLSEDNNLKELAIKIVKDYNEIFNDDELNNANTQLNSLKNKISKATDDYIEAPKDIKPNIAEKIENLKLQEKELETKIMTLKIHTAKKLDVQGVEDFIKKFMNNRENNSEIIKALVHSVYADNNGVVVYINCDETINVNSDELFKQAKTTLQNAGGSSVKTNGSSKMSRLEPFIFKGLIGIKIIF